MPQFDQEKMARLVSHLRKSVARLRDLRNITQDRFVDDPDKVASAKYHFIVAIEAAIDMCNHLISRNGFRAPEDYADTFQVMVEQGALEREFSEELKRMAKFRNRLVHLYWEVDDEQVYQILQSRLSDFKIFLDSLARFLAWPENSAS
jgi:uncharacterized protein YutE (UPF0331/DUF86 family)